MFRMNENDEKIKDVITTSDKPILIKTENSNHSLDKIIEWLNNFFKCTMKDKDSFSYNKDNEFDKYINLCYANENDFYVLIINDIGEIRHSDLAYIWSIINADNFPKNSKTIFLQNSKHNSLAAPLDIIPSSSVTTIDITGENLSIINYEQKNNSKRR